MPSYDSNMLGDHYCVRYSLAMGAQICDQQIARAGSSSVTVHHRIPPQSQGGTASHGTIK